MDKNENVDYIYNIRDNWIIIINDSCVYFIEME